MDVLMLPPLIAVDSSNRFPEIKTHVKQVASYISFLFNTFYFNTWISSFDRWLILLTFTICTRRACRVDLYFQIGPRHKLTSETVKGHSPHIAQHGWIMGESTTAGPHVPCGKPGLYLRIRRTPNFWFLPRWKKCALYAGIYGTSYLIWNLYLLWQALNFFVCSVIVFL